MERWLSFSGAIGACLFILGFLGGAGAEGQTPSLDDTEQFLTNYGSTNALMTAASEGKDKLMISSRVKFSASKCSVRSEFEVKTLYPALEGKPPTITTARRGELSRAAILPQSSEGAWSNPEQSVVLFYKSGPANGVMVGYYDLATAERVKRALDHWLQICPDDREPF